ncbi:hypothetical protein K5D69_09415 [Pseudomonas cichorii]|uniref:hypothetical protein n=1 Tax=Pseudomonas cichorii TaxID=36746 RepID=UPI001C8AD876|nr:hypothetical protein [Pseudomonas cichorii]MBX8514912.1 hypothetical protein [Pseudomonas cichorii]
MSYEYRLVFDDATTAQHVIGVVEASSACIRAESGDVYLKDKFLNSRAEYDARLTYEGKTSLWLQVNFKSMDLYALVQKALSGRHFRCLEDGDEGDEVELNEAFRIKSSL